MTHIKMIALIGALFIVLVVLGLFVFDQHVDQHAPLILTFVLPIVTGLLMFAGINPPGNPPNNTTDNQPTSQQQYPFSSTRAEGRHRSEDR